MKKTLNIESDSLEALLEKRRKGLNKQIDEFLLKYKKTKLDKVGNVIDDTNPYLVSIYFFEPLSDVFDANTNYTAEQLANIWAFYNEVIMRINMEITQFQPTLSHFATFAGLSLETLQTFKQSNDPSMKTLVEKIYTHVFDANMSLAQGKKVTEKATTYRMKVENEAIEKKSPSINVNVGTKQLDLDKIGDRLKEIKVLTKKQISYEGK